MRERAARQKRTWLFSAQLPFSSGENFPWNVGGPRAAAGCRLCVSFRGTLLRLMYYLKRFPAIREPHKLVIGINPL